MEFQIVSDLHLDFKDNFIWALDNLKPEADTLLIAGDTCEYKLSLRAKYHIQFFNKWKTVIEVPGNHDSYGFHAKEENRKQCFENYVTAHDDVGQSTWNYINNDMIDLDDNIRVICTTLWSAISPHNHITIENGMSDYSEIREFTIDKNNAIHKMSVDFLERSLKDSVGKKCIILTHHLPLWSLINPRFERHPLNEAYVNDLTDIMTRYNDTIKMWVHGHSHDFMKKQCGDIVCVRNPVGYIKYGEGRDYQPTVIEL